MHEIRCSKCNKLLAKGTGNISIKCPRCGHIHIERHRTPLNGANDDGKTKAKKVM